LQKRIQRADLPGPLKNAISARTGPIISGRAVTDGQNSTLAAVIETRDGKTFVKGLPSDHRPPPRRSLRASPRRCCGSSMRRAGTS
jgi:hypothetical protein